MVNRRTRIAWAVSIALHAALFAGLWLLGPRAPDAAPPTDFDVVLTLAPAPVERDLPITLATSSPAKPSAPAEVAGPAKSTPATGRPPVVVPVPAALPGAVATFVRERGDRLTAAPVRDVVDVQQASAQVKPDANVAPATATVPAREAAEPVPGGGSPLHGPLPTGRTVVYVLDCSGTMGLGGKLARASAVLLATIAAQPKGVRVLVVTYSGRAAPLTDGGPAEATDAVRERIAVALAKQEPAGESRHAEGVRVALKFDPDFVLLLTDADDAELAEARPVVAGARRPLSVSAARVTAECVEAPRTLR